MSKAFDSVNHHILLSKLQDVGVSLSCLQWFCSYLSNRYQVVRINSTVSSPRPVTCGVPQGSILGPLLFNIYVNDAPTIPQKCSSQSFVDDTKLYLSFKLKDQSQAITEINQDLTRFRNWCFNNYLLLNTGKSKLMVFGSRQMISKLDNFQISLVGKDLNPVNSAKDLGLILDSFLTYDEHVIKTISSCTAILCQINRVKHVFDRPTLIQIIKSLVFSKLFYCSNVWSNTSQKNIKKLQAIQFFACRIVSSKRKFDHISGQLKGQLPIATELEYRNGVMAYKCMSGRAPKYLADKFKSRYDITNRRTRNQEKLQIPRFKLATGQRTFQYRCVKLWNDLDTKLKQPSSTNNFKRNLKKSLLKKF